MRAVCTCTHSASLRVKTGSDPVFPSIGRKNWLFAGNDKAGATAATLYSLIASAERHNLDPQRYLTSVLANIAATPVSELQRFLPDVWEREDAVESAARVISHPT